MKSPVRAQERNGLLCKNLLPISAIGKKRQSKKDNLVRVRSGIHRSDVILKTLDYFTS